MWTAIDKDAFEAGRGEWPIVNGGELFSGGAFEEYGHRDGYGLWRRETSTDGSEKWYRWE